MREPLLLDQDFVDFLDLIESTEESVFLTGKAGTGKSTLLQLFRRTTRKKIIVLAPTGVAALNVKGQTIHSFFNFAPRLLSESDIKRVKNPKFFQSLDTIVIDEISMVRADLLDNIDYALRMNRNDDRHFGGLQMIFIGDLYQLPPVVASHQEKVYFNSVYSTPYFFSAKVFERGFKLDYYELSTVYRQEERRFINLLEAIRSRDVDREILEEVNERVEAPLEPDCNYITLTTRNAVAERINNTHLEELISEKRTYDAQVKGQFAPRLFPTEAALRLKVGAQVMFMKNDPLKRFVNGTIGEIIGLEPDKVLILLRNHLQEKTVEVERMEWEIVRYTDQILLNEVKTQVVGSFVQFPLKLAWAITVHKSQGKTFDHVIIDLQGGAFEHGQTYVALSRCRSLDGIVLNHPVRYQDVLVDERIIDFQRDLCR